MISRRFEFNGVYCKDNVTGKCYYVQGNTEFTRFVEDAIYIINTLNFENKQLRREKMERALHEE